MCDYAGKKYEPDNNALVFFVVFHGPVGRLTNREDVWGKFETVFADVVLKHTLRIDRQQLVRVEGNQHLTDVGLGYKIYEVFHTNAFPNSTYVDDIFLVSQLQVASDLLVRYLRQEGHVV